MSNGETKNGKDIWDKLNIILNAISSIGIVLIIFIITTVTTETSKKADLNQRKLETAYKLIPDLLDSNIAKRHIAIIGVCNSLIDVDQSLLFKVLNTVINSKTEDFDFKSHAYECLAEINPGYVDSLQNMGKNIVKDSLITILKKIQSDSVLTSSDINNIQEAKKTLNKRNIVYIQYDRSCKPKAEDIAKQLSGNYIVPPVDAVSYNGENQIRYFSDGDKSYADNLKNDLQKITGNVLMSVKQVYLKKTNIPDGQLEIWLNQDICK